jgi:hypothetical protein
MYGDSSDEALRSGFPRMTSIGSTAVAQPASPLDPFPNND